MTQYRTGVTGPTIEEWADGWRRTARRPYGQWVYHLHGALPYGDPELSEVLIYVGITNNLERRLRQHSRKWWWEAVHLDRSEAYGVDTRALALEAEARDIIERQPAINRSGRLALVVQL